MNSYLLPAVLLMGLSISFTAQGSIVSRLKQQDSFAINRGKIFHISTLEQSVHQVKGLDDVAQILLFKGSVVAREDDGGVYLLEENYGSGSGQWVRIGADTDNLVTDGNQLFAVGTVRSFWNNRERKEISVFTGAPGDLVWTYTSVPVACGPNQMCTSGAVPTLAGRQLAFAKKKIGGVVDLLLENDKAVVLTNDGRKIVLSIE